MVERNNLKFIRKTIKTRELEIHPYINLYPLPCLHIGAEQSDVIFIRQHIRRIKEDPNALWVYMGDGGECVTKGSKGDIYQQLYSPEEQVEILEELLTPIKDKAWFGIRGNHGNRIYKETGLSFDSTVCRALGMPYMEVETWAHLEINRSRYSLFFHHGIDSGTTMQAKYAKAEQFTKFVDADALFTAHSHVAAHLPPACLLSYNEAKQGVVTKLRHQYIAGCGYDSRTGYAAEKGYPPLLPAFIRVTFNGRVIHGYATIDQQYIRWGSDAQHPVNGIYRRQVAYGI